MKFGDWSFGWPLARAYIHGLETGNWRQFFRVNRFRIGCGIPSVIP